MIAVSVAKLESGEEIINKLYASIFYFIFIYYYFSAGARFTTETALVNSSVFNRLF